MQPSSKTQTDQLQSCDHDRLSDLTIEEVRKLEKYRDCTDEEIQALIDTIKAFTNIVYNIFSKGRNSGRKIALHIDNQQTKAA